MDNQPNINEFRERRDAQKKSASPAEDFTGPATALQVRVPKDLVTSLKLHSFQSGRTISEIVLECLTSDAAVTKAWVSTRRAG